jgi:hypoxanthine phosphoribosyltransferase
MGEEAEVSKLFYDYETLVGDLQHIVRDMSVAQYKPDVVVGPGRGAYFPGVMLSHYFEVPFEGFRWQYRDGNLQDESTLEHIIDKHQSDKILIVDDINDTGTTLQSIDNYIFEWATNEVVDIQLKYATLLTKSTSSFEQVNFYARELTPDYDPWVVFPYEQWWNFKEIG